MRQISLIALAVLAFAGASVELAAAADGCGRGRFWNGYRCVSTGGYYGPRAYGPPPGYYDGGRSYGPPPPRGRPDDGSRFMPGVDRQGKLQCPRGYTVQDGICKPYRGF